PRLHEVPDEQQGGDADPGHGRPLPGAAPAEPPGDPAAPGSDPFPQRPAPGPPQLQPRPFGFRHRPRGLALLAPPGPFLAHRYVTGFMTRERCAASYATAPTRRRPTSRGGTGSRPGARSPPRRRTSHRART